VALEAIEERHVVKQLLDELDGMSNDSDEWIAKLTVLRKTSNIMWKKRKTIFFQKPARY
jgi:hypothetical protein